MLEYSWKIVKCAGHDKGQGMKFDTMTCKNVTIYSKLNDYLGF